MTIGIYALYWADPDLIYIGQSIDIEHRFITHVRSLSNNKHFNYKVQEAYIKYGSPQTSILEVCSITDLDTLETLYTNEFSNLLNIAEAGNAPRGANARNSKYSKISLLRVFAYLYKTKLSSVDISKLTKVSVYTVYDIREGRAHNWLKESYPDKYSKMLSIAISATKIKKPELSKELLDSLIPHNSWVTLGKLFGYSDSGIKKRALSLGCAVPNRRKFLT